MSTFFKKGPKTVFLTVFSKIWLRRKNFAKIGAKQCFERARKINLVDLKKKIVKIFECFLKIRPPPPRENPRSAPGYTYPKTTKISFQQKIRLLINKISYHIKIPLKLSISISISKFSPII